MKNSYTSYTDALQKRAAKGRFRRAIQENGWYIAGILVVVGFLALGAYNIVVANMDKREINKAIYPAFRNIERHCSSYVSRTYVSQNELERCQKVVTQMNACVNRPEYCYADEYYQYLEELGFQLPPLYTK